MSYLKLRLAAGTLVFAALASTTAAAQSTARRQFVPEPVSVFADAYQHARQVRLDARHSDQRQYHAFRVAGSGPSVVIARSVTLDAAGHMHIYQEPGTTAHGQVVSGGGDMHILLPASVTPPR